MQKDDQEKIATILVVDDEDSLREICRDALQEEGHKVLEAENGRQAQLMLVKHPEIDLIISDLRMPQMGGLELLQYIAEKNLDIDFLVMTGFASIETAVECIKTGAADYLPKPFNISHLLVKVEKVIKNRYSRKEKKRLSNIVKMLNVSSALNAQLDLKSICYEFVSQVQRNFQPDSVALFLLEEKGSLSKSVIRGRKLREHPELFKELKNLSYKAAYDGKTYMLDNGNAGNYLNLESGNFEYSILITPLYSQLNKVGAVVLLRHEDNLFNNEDSQLLGVFAAHAATAMQNARMYGKMRDKNLDIIRSYAKAVEAKDYYTKGHSDRVAVYAMKLGSRLKLMSKELEDLYTAGVLHDIGKIGIPDHILNKPSRLTDDEFRIMQGHPQIARDILAQLWSLNDILPLVYHHHERVDGEGYPDNIGNGQIPFLAKVISVVDAFEAMTSDRAYRNALSWEQARVILLQGSGTQWDHELVAEWIDLVQETGLEKIQKDVQTSPAQIET
ncbi:HD domain-containing phosphohydrolase [Desulfonatronospira sp.]|uniref:HD domain-containing phosphohydrolase n=1 Tax=Desulfonatronospira sp. TaxID=1962951 RepID=UPI0025C59A65|nr:HD domain-containing phosphohydrolase [Desulfonatronospira sp.]